MPPITCEVLVTTALNEWLGCNYSVIPAGWAPGQSSKLTDAVFTALSPLLSKSEHAELVMRTCVTMIERYDHGSVNAWCVENRIMGIVLNTDTWRTYLGSPESGRALACVVLRYLVRGGSRRSDRPVCSVEAAGELAAPLQRMLGAWLTPLQVNAKTTKRDFVAAIFGEAWCALVIDNHDEDISLARLIEQTAPSFLPGRLTAGADAPLPMLPEMVDYQR